MVVFLFVVVLLYRAVTKSRAMSRVCFFWGRSVTCRSQEAECFGKGRKRMWEGQCGMLYLLSVPENIRVSC